jgi:hypothetical protein
VRCTSLSSPVWAICILCMVKQGCVQLTIFVSWGTTIAKALCSLHPPAAFSSTSAGDIVIIGRSYHDLNTCRRHEDMSMRLVDLAVEEAKELFDLKNHFLCSTENVEAIKRMIAGDTSHVAPGKAWLYTLVNNTKTGMCG